MSNWLTRRADYWKAVLYTKVRAGMGLLLAALTIGMTLRDSVLDPKYRDTFLLKYIPELGARTWLIIGLGGLILLILESGYRKDRDVRLIYLRKHRRRVRELEERHQAELTSVRLEELVRAQRAELEDSQRRLELARTPVEPVSLEALEQHYEIKKLVPNLVHGESKAVGAHEGEHGIIVEGWREGAKNFIALIVPYHNSPHPNRAIGEIGNASAQLYFRFFDGRSPLVVHRGAWLSKKSNKVEFGKNDKLSLVVVTVDEADRVYAVGRDFDDVNPDGVTRREELTQDLASVRISIITESDGKTVDVYEVMFEIIREPDFKVKLTELRLWKWIHLIKFQNEGLQLSIRIYELERDDQFKDETKSKVVEETIEWETRAGSFIGRHLGETQKKSFVEAHPSIAHGAIGARRLSVPLPVRPSKEATPRQAVYTPQYWSIHDAINARVKKLEEHAKSVWPFRVQPRTQA